MEFDFAPRLNLLTGDNGLGKSFLLDVLWYAHTWTWAGTPAWPRPEAKRDTGPRPGRNYLTSAIDYRFVDGASGGRSYRCSYHAMGQDWQPWAIDPKGQWLLRDGGAGGAGADRFEESMFPGDGVVLYARVDGGFCVWDSYRNRGRFPPPGSGVDERPALYRMTPEEVWDGPADGSKLYNGLLRDWASWQQTRKTPWIHLRKVLKELSGEGVESLRPGKQMVRIGIEDARDIPTLELPYGTVPLTHASAGMKRICALAYMIVWAWQEHRLAAQAVRGPTARQLVVLIDEVEAHLHPVWQRRVLPALMGVLEGLGANVQVFAATHSPMVLASLEATFDEEQDDLFHFELDGSVVSAAELPFAKQGDASNWLVSEVFGLRRPRSLESERAIEAALAWMRKDDAAAAAQLGHPASEAHDRTRLHEEIHARLVQHLPGHDDFWPTWLVASPRKDAP